jgi:sugar phosphate permease
MGWKGKVDANPSCCHSEARAWFVWVLAVTFVVYYFSFQTGYSIVNSNVQKDIGLSVPQVATVAALYTWVFALCQFFSGALLDRLGAGKIIPVSIALVTIGRNARQCEVQEVLVEGGEE